LTQELARSVEELRALSEVGQAVSSSLDLRVVLTTIIAHATRLAGADTGVLWGYDPAARTFAVQASHGYDPDFLSAYQARFGTSALETASMPFSEAAIQTRETVQYPDLTEV